MIGAFLFAPCHLLLYTSYLSLHACHLLRQRSLRWPAHSPCCCEPFRRYFRPANRTWTVILAAQLSHRYTLALLLICCARGPDCEAQRCNVPFSEVLLRMEVFPGRRHIACAWSLRIHSFHRFVSVRCMRRSAGHAIFWQTRRLRPSRQLNSYAWPTPKPPFVLLRRSN